MDEMYVSMRVTLEGGELYSSSAHADQRRAGVLTSSMGGYVSIWGTLEGLGRLISALQDAERMLIDALHDVGDPAGELCDVGGEPTAE